ncbi:MAG: hypothetical protein M3Y65_02480 [Pseudomonadota bacterium]|nr:hypothetical protein [Pseudomonadota bacterium]
MKSLIALITLALAMPLAVHAAEPPLFQLVVTDAPVENGKLLDMEFHEVARTAEGSTVQIVRRSGGSLSSSMFVLRGMCGVVRVRCTRQFQVEKLAGDDERYSVTFPSTQLDASKGFTLAQCEQMKY